MGDRLEPVDPGGGEEPSRDAGVPSDDTRPPSDAATRSDADTDALGEARPGPSREPAQRRSEGLPRGWSPNQPPMWTSPHTGWTSGEGDWADPQRGSGGATSAAGSGARVGEAPPGWSKPISHRPDIKPGVIPLRPLGVGEILDGAISAIRDHPRVMLGISAVVAVLSALLTGVADWITLRDFETVDTATATDEEILRAFATGLTATGAGFLVISLATVVATGVLTVVIGRAVLGQSLTLRQAWESARPYLLRLVGLWVLTVAVVVGVVVAALVPGILLVVAGAGRAASALIVLGVLGGLVAGIHVYVRLALAPPALMLEKQRVVASMRRSARLVKSSWWRIFWILALAFILAVILRQIIQTPFGVLGYGPEAYFGMAEFSPPSVVELAIASIGLIIAATITLPFLAGVTTLLYVDRRIRREGLDIELARAAQAGARSPSAGHDHQ